MRRAARATASRFMGKTPRNGVHKRAPCSALGSLARTEMLVAVVCRMAQLPDNGEIPGQGRQRLRRRVSSFAKVACRPAWLHSGRRNPAVSRATCAA